MKILYVTGSWRGIKNILFEGQTEGMGMPAFVKPLKALLEAGNQVDIILIHKFDKFPEYNIKVNWIKPENIKATLKWEFGLKGRLTNDIKVRKLTENIISNGKYDFVYGHGSSSQAAARAAMKYKVPYGQRIYGSFLYSYIEKYGSILGSIRMFHDYKMFTNRQAFTLITNDGTKGDITYNLVNSGSGKSDMYFWLNGIDHMQELTDDQLNSYKNGLTDKPFLFHFARIQSVKGQDKAIELLNLLRKRGIDINLVFGGQCSDPDFKIYLEKKIKEYSLEDNVKFLGQVTRDEINALAKLSIASVLFYYSSSLGNCFHELL
jgi:glycosyltransferase involved in cell wall biosynthesis